uniref:Uncharacterized protein n=1 Tax=Parascaris univalens TaxID=6257 RepID=A0A915BMD3_PARUN
LITCRMVVGTGLVIACAIGGYLYFCDKRECAERLRAWAEKLSDQTSHEVSNSIVQSFHSLLPENSLNSPTSTVTWEIEMVLFGTPHR